MMDQDTNVRIRLDDMEDLEAAEAASKETEVSLQKEQEPTDLEVFEPVSAVLVGGAVLALGRFIFSWWDRRKGGLVIDLRKDRKDDLYRDPDVAFGYVVVFASDGTVTIETKDEPKDAIERLLDTLVRAPFESAADVAKAAMGEVKDEDKVKTDGPKTDQKASS